nr:uncharacterized protein LOC122270203 [Parasteatoda tepidariorum]
MNTSKCEMTGYTAAYLQFGRELRTVQKVKHDIRTVIQNDNFVPEITPYLRKFSSILLTVGDNVEKSQDRHKTYFDSKRPTYAVGSKVWVTLHPLSNAKKGITAKFVPKRDGPYLIIRKKSPTSYELAHPDKPRVPVGTYHTSALRQCNSDTQATEPILPLRRRGRPKINSDSSPGRNLGIRGGEYHKRVGRYGLRPRANQPKSP